MRAIRTLRETAGLAGKHRQEEKCYETQSGVGPSAPESSRCAAAGIRVRGVRPQVDPPEKEGKNSYWPRKNCLVHMVPGIYQTNTGRMIMKEDCI